MPRRDAYKLARRERIKKMIVELSRKYPIYVDGKPLHQIHAQQSILAYAAMQ